MIINKYNYYKGFNFQDLLTKEISDNCPYQVNLKYSPQPFEVKKYIEKARENVIFELIKGLPKLPPKTKVLIYSTINYEIVFSITHRIKTTMNKSVHMCIDNANKYYCSIDGILHTYNYNHGNDEILFQMVSKILNNKMKMEEIVLPTEAFNKTGRPNSYLEPYYEDQIGKMIFYRSIRVFYTQNSFVECYALNVYESNKQSIAKEGDK